MLRMSSKKWSAVVLLLTSRKSNLTTPDQRVIQRHAKIVHMVIGTVLIVYTNVLFGFN